jgi:hydroxymethylbilane synthase
MSKTSTFLIATRGSALALAQANQVMAQCRSAFPDMRFDLTIIKTTGDKLQTASLAQESHSLPKGLFTKELEVALLEGKAGLAVHSLKDLPTDLPEGLVLGAVGEREDVRDVLIYRDRSAPAPQRGYAPGLRVQQLPQGAVVATSSTRRKAQLLTANPGLKVPDIRGNVLTRIRKIAENPDLDATILALAGLSRLHYRIGANGTLSGEGIPAGFLAAILDTDTMLPCVGQGAIGLEIRAGDELALQLCSRLNHEATHQCVLAERAFLQAMGGGCQSPVAAHAVKTGEDLRMRALSFASGPVKRAEGSAPADAAIELGKELAMRLKS